jgi:hypothetical protein
MGRADPLCPGTSDVDLLSDRQCVVDFDAKIANRALDFAVAQNELNRSQIPGPPIDERRFRSPQRMRPKEAWVQSDSGNPVRYQSRVLPGRDGHPATAVADQERFPRLLPSGLEGAGVEYVSSWTIRVVGNRAALTLLAAIDPKRSYDRGQSYRPAA